MKKTSDTVTPPICDPAKKNTHAGSLLVGQTVYLVNISFGKIPLDEILKNRILHGSKSA